MVLIAFLMKWMCAPRQQSVRRTTARAFAVGLVRPRPIAIHVSFLYAHLGPRWPVLDGESGRLLLSFFVSADGVCR